MENVLVPNLPPLAAFTSEFAMPIPAFPVVVQQGAALKSWVSRMCMLLDPT